MNEFIAGIIKGIEEKGDASAHFGSLRAYGSYLQDTIELGLIDNDMRLTKAGKEYYKQKKLVELRDCRAYLWDERDWAI